MQTDSLSLRVYTGLYKTITEKQLTMLLTVFYLLCMLYFCITFYFHCLLIVYHAFDVIFLYIIIIIIIVIIIIIIIFIQPFSDKNGLQYNKVAGQFGKLCITKFLSEK